MATIFPLSASVGQEFEGYIYDGTIWNLIGNEYNPTVYSAYEPDNPKPGDLWVDSSIDVPVLSINNVAYQTDLDNYLTIESASSTYATKSELDNIDLSPYLTQSSASSTYATKSELNNIDLSSASAAAVSYLVNGAPAALDTLNELAEALNDDSSFSTTVTNSLANKLDIFSASTTYAVINNSTFTGTSTFNDIIIDGKLNASEIVENVSDVSISSGSVSLDFNTSNIFYITSSPSANFTVNLLNAPTTDGRTFTVTIIVPQGATGYIPSSLFINGSSQTIRWTAGATPVPTSSSGKIDIFNFTVIRRSSSWIVLGTYSTNF